MLFKCLELADAVLHAIMIALISNSTNFFVIFVNLSSSCSLVFTPYGKKSSSAK